MADTYLTTGGPATRRPLPEDRPGPQIGDTKGFKPQALFPTDGGNVTGTCVYINEAHRFARYEYISPGAGTAWECFKF